MLNGAIRVNRPWKGSAEILSAHESREPSAAT
jgi:hypothetical protein